MPQAVTYHYLGKPSTTYFSQAKALLPVKLANEQIKLVPWGRRLQENSEMPLGGWALLSSIHQGKWQHLSPKPVRLSIEKFMIIDYENHTCWYEIMRGQWVQGLLAQLDQEYRVYIVTVIPERLDTYYDRWPRIIFNKPSL